MPSVAANLEPGGHCGLPSCLHPDCHFPSGPVPRLHPGAGPISRSTRDWRIASAADRGSRSGRPRHADPGRRAADCRRGCPGTYGILQGLSPSALRVATKNGSSEVPLTEVRQVRRRGDRLWDGLAIGAAVGAAFGAGTFVPCESDPIACGTNLTTTRGGDALATAAMFSAIGLGIDALHQGWRTRVHQASHGAP